MKKKSNFKKLLSLRDLSAAKLFKINKSDNKSVSQIPSTTVKRFFAKNSAFRLLPKSIYRDLIFSVKEETFGEFEDSILFSNKNSIQRKFWKFKNYFPLRQFSFNPDVNEHSDKLKSLSEKLIYIIRWRYQYDILKFLHLRTQNTEVSGDYSEMLKAIEIELEKTFDSKYKQEDFLLFFSMLFLRTVRFAKK